MKGIGKHIVKHKIAIIIISLLLFIPSLIGMIKTKVNYDILVYLPKDIETLKGEHILTDDFKTGAYATIVVEDMPNKNLLKLEDEIRKVDGVVTVLSVADITGTTIPVEMLPENIKNKVAVDNTKLLLVTFENSTSDDKTLEAVSEIRKITDKNCLVGGVSAMVLDTKELFNSEMLKYVVIAVICCIIVLEFALDSYVVPFLLLGNIGAAILYNMGTNILLGDICYITKAISSVLQLGVTTDFSIFLYHKYEKAKKTNKDKNKAMAEAINETLVSVAGSSLTTIAGFLALCTMDLTLGTDIGLIMAKGVVFGVLCVITLFPTLLLIFDKQIDKTKHKNLLPSFNKIKELIVKYRKAIIVVFIILYIPAYYCQKQTKVYYNLDKSIPDTYGYRIATKELKEKYNIVSPEIILVSKGTKTEDIEHITEELEKVKGIDLVLSPSKLGGLNNLLPEELTSKFSNDKYELILINSVYDLATPELNNQIAKVNKIVHKYDKKAIIAGEGPLMNDLVKVTDRDFKSVNYTSILVIFVLMLFVFKSISIPVILVATIELAIFINMGIPYLTGTKLPFVASVVIGTIQLGATIDYAILMTTKYIEERKNKNDKYKSIKIALDNSVTSIFVSGMCFFAATIGVGLISNIDIIGSLCTLISRGAIISMVIVISVLPSLLVMFDKLIIKTTLGFKGGK